MISKVSALLRSPASLIQRVVILGSVVAVTVALATSMPVASAVASAPAAGKLHTGELQKVFEKLAAAVPGRIGVCARDAAGEACVNGDQRSSMQSVVKLIVGLATLEEVDRGRWKLDDAVIVRKQDLSVGVQPISKRITTPEGFRTTIADLVKRAIVDSDSAACDILIAKLGGPKSVQAFLDRHKIAGIRVDRDERHLQTDTMGLTWKPEYVDTDTLMIAVKAVPDAQREAAFAAYRKDPRDTSSPRAMANLLQALADGTLLSAASTKHVLDVMEETVTFPDRLKAGLRDGWTIGHKTGTSGTRQGITVATNDVGVLKAPDGTRISIAVLVSDSPAPSEMRAKLMADLTRATIDHYR
jgi:beta-lactamase class A